MKNISKLESSPAAKAADAADALATAVCHAPRGGVRTSLARAGSRG